ncbi:hypothetical protein PHYBLDRAFT_73077 [Phycomyces blakesleeanus NRRL 1555(-)]|uniref:Uncharacterized protein n=1 Tax=Phycomyces blakesleeanus (strain ATCC 8743b / DSM 1359 / FGSC 10004 / NBRC 33097 / NRRL 1555) TaxID=763407 RepID=A0A167MF07_PHYB8|nr:hypothetical protein PHYBLDRAFT_73077 [Phycomyces blakesleeanus NRRL 1555(-)]OAD72669.1 hypothetical protein PHYBLDRAFT_73077 [Phycomyces blakesleeanus NRRL 1555(-)]|eukprot:XP_018290709.1 hypothetical protein PHYBLDRAFT_73077 [Phycomyces blakesleeanus NRRL 1555(-)]
MQPVLQTVSKLPCRVLGVAEVDFSRSRQPGELRDTFWACACAVVCHKPTSFSCGGNVTCNHEQRCSDMDTSWALKSWDVNNKERGSATNDTSSLLWWLKLKKFLRGRIEDLRLGTKICENLCRFCLLRKDFVSKFGQVPTLNYYCYLYCFGLGKLYDWGQSQ